MRSNPERSWPAIRIAWIERRAARVGTIRRSDITEGLGVSLAQASEDLQALLNLRPGCLTYDLPAKLYRWTGDAPALPLPALLAEFDIHRAAGGAAEE